MIVQAAKIIGSGLATIGLTNILLSLIQNDSLLLSKINITELGKKGISTIDKMIESLPKDSLLLKFLMHEIALSSLKIYGKVENGLIVHTNMILLDLNYKNKMTNIIDSKFYIAGVYVFIAPNGEQYVGSCMDFNSRLIDYKHQFKNRRRPTKIHLGKYKFTEYKWSSIYITLNYYNLFISKFPYYILTQGEIDILMAVTQLIPSP